MVIKTWITVRRVGKLGNTDIQIVDREGWSSVIIRRSGMKRWFIKISTSNQFSQLPFIPFKMFFHEVTTRSWNSPDLSDKINTRELNEKSLWAELKHIPEIEEWKIQRINARVYFPMFKDRNLLFKVWCFKLKVWWLTPDWLSVVWRLGNSIRIPRYYRILIILGLRFLGLGENNMKVE